MDTDTGTADSGSGTESEPGIPRVSPWWIAAIAGLTILAGLASWVFFEIRDRQRPVPHFASLQEHPDAALHGTLAYFARDNCVHLAAVSGAWDRPLRCVDPTLAAGKAATTGKPVGPQLVWRSDGRLEITMFTMSMQQGAAPDYLRGSAEVVDPRTGAVEALHGDAVPATPNRTTHPVLNARGDRVEFASEPDGRVSITLVTATGSRTTVMSGRGPSGYGYSLGAAFWSPDGTWIAADDGRILVVVPGRRPSTRVLVEHPGDWGFDAQYARFALSATDLPASGSGAEPGK